MGSRHPNPRLAKIHRCYSVEEIARLFMVHKNSVRSWLRQGLQAIDGQRPTLVRGEEIRLFLVERRTRAKCLAAPAASTVCLAARRKCLLAIWPNALRLATPPARSRAFVRNATG